MKKRSNRKYVCVSLTLSLALAAVHVSAEEAEYPLYSQYLSGAEAQGYPESEADYTVISVSTREDLFRLAQECQLDAWSRDKYILLENDIVLEEDDSVVIPSFGGIFEGNGHSISNFRITSSGSAQGLFRYIQSGGTVRGLSVFGSVMPGGEGNRIGLLAGVNYGRILDCSAVGSVTGTGEVGGIAGVNETSGEIRRCQSSVTVTGEHSTGGICGVNRGTLNNCVNTGSINTHSADVTYGIEDITIENLEDLGSTESVAAHTDTGGIAGYSEGKIYYCTNSGSVGYQHVGYNTGGIVGRLHQGYLQNCTNSGRILGRKDVGGIAGQMEPFLEVQYMNDRLSRIDRETDTFFNLLEKANDDLQGYGGEISDLAGEVSGHLTNASSAFGSIVGTANELWYIYNQELTVINSDLDRLNQKIAQQSVPGDVPDADLSWADVRERTESYIAALRKFGEDTNKNLSDIIAATNDKNGSINGSLDILNRELDAACTGLGQLADLLGETGDNASANVDALLRQAKVLRSSIRGLRDDLFRYEGISVRDTSDDASADISDGDSGDTSGEASGEAAYDTSSFQQGKITLCVNTGSIEADANVGGIVGQVATEYDFDPEDDVTFTGTESFSIEQTVKAVVRESRNEGAVTAKKDFVGGIVGKADHGAVISCESYGPVSSSGGSYAGGIAGFSGYCIRNCYFMGTLSGKNYVGGIAGRGSDIFGSYAYPQMEWSGEYAGSIAGLLEEEGTLYGNYYVQGSPGDSLSGGMSGNAPGVDSIGYEGGAEPLDYVELCSREEVPEGFREFTVRFQADGREIAALHCRYGEALDKAQIPEIPEKEGYYGIWPEFDYGCVTGNCVLEAQYERWISSLASEEASAEGRPAVLVQGEFLPADRLLTETLPEGTRLTVAFADEAGEIAGQYERSVLVRACCDDSGAPVKDAVIELWNGENYVRVPSRAVGGYLEFTMDTPGIFRITALQKTNAGIYIAAAGGVAGIGIALFLMRKKRRRKHAGRAENERSTEKRAERER